MRRLLARKGASQYAEGGDDAQGAGDGQSPSPSSSVTAFSTSGSGSLSRKSTSDDAGAYNNALGALKAIPLPADPEAFVEAALGPIFNHNPKHDLLSFQDVATHHVPRFFSLDYRHQVNCDELDLEGWLNRLSGIRTKVKKARIRFVKSSIDHAERQSMQRACVSLNYEVVLAIPDKGEDEIRIPAVSIFNIKHGKLVSGIAVVDAREVHASGPSLSCTVS